MSKKIENKIEETVVETEVLEGEVSDELAEVKESKIKKVWNKIKKPAGFIGLFAGGVILGNILAGRNADEDLDLDFYDLDDVTEDDIKE